MGNVKRKRATRFRGTRLASSGMRTRASVLVLVGLVLLALQAGSKAVERDKTSGILVGSNRNSEAAQAAADDSKAIDKLIREINAAVREDKRRMMSIIIINTNVAATTLEQQKARTGLSFGDIYVAHALSLATRKKFDTIISSKTRGRSWSQIARAHNVSLKGSTALLNEMMKR